MVRISSHPTISGNSKFSKCTIKHDLLSSAKNYFNDVSETLLLTSTLAIALAKWSYDEFHISYSDDLSHTGIFESVFLTNSISIEEWFIYCDKQLMVGAQAEKNASTHQNERKIFVTFEYHQYKSLPGDILFSFIKNKEEYTITCSWIGDDPYPQWSMFFDRFILLFENIIKSGKKPLCDYSFLTKMEWDNVKNSLQNDYFSENQNDNITQVFREIVNKYPEAIAIDKDNRLVTYDELDKLSSHFSIQLLNEGISPGECILVFLEGHFEFVIVAIAILKIGCTYIPIDVDFPMERIQFIINDSKAEALISQEEINEKISSFLTIPQILIEMNSLEGVLINNLEQISSSSKSNVACVMYTSGSTGNPKGVCITHKNILALAKDALPNEFGTKDCFLNSANVTFDASLFNLWCALLNGSRYVIISKNTLLDATELGYVLKQKAVTVLTLTTSLFHQLATERVDMFSSLSLLIAGGEQLQENVIKKMGGVLPKKLLNGYGPTECTTYTTTFLVNTHVDGTIPIGKPLPYAKLFVLDRFKNPLPSGIIGELYIAGAGVSAGYLNAPERTNKVFISNIIASTHEQTFYKTGDLVFSDTKGNYVFVGRRDRQVKISGHRIELFEIEKRALLYPNTQQCVALINEGRNHHKRLILFYSTECQAFDESNFHTYLGDHLPAYMIPKRYYRLKKFPLTATGKIDNHKLYSIALSSNTKSNLKLSSEQENPSDQMKKIWEYYLQIPSVDENDNFFSLGGDSITAIQISSAARQYGIVFQPAQLLESNSLGDLLKKIKIISIINEKKHPILGAESFPLSPIQYWFFDMELPNNNFFTMSYYIKCRQPISFEILKKAFNLVVLNHPSFFLGFINVDNKYQQKYIIPSDLDKAEFVEKVYIPSSLSVEDKRFFLRTHALRIQTQLNLQNSILIKVIFFEENDETLPILFIAIHHIIMDGISWRILLEDLSSAYDALDHNDEPSLLLEKCSFEDWIVALAKYDVPVKARTYWKNITEHAWVPLVNDDAVNREADLLIYTQVVDEEKAKQLIVQAPMRLNISINAILLGALSLAVKAAFGVSKFTLDIEGHGRESILDEIDSSRTIGWFTILYPLTLGSESYFQEEKDFDEKQKMIAFLQEKHHFLSSIPTNGFEYLLLQSTDVLSNKLRPQVKFNYLGRFQGGKNDLFSFDMENSIPQSAEKNTWPYLLDVELSLVDEKLVIHFKYNKNKIKAKEAEALAENYLKIISQINDIVKTFPSEKIICYGNRVGGTNEFSNVDSISTRRTLHPLIPMQASLLFHAVSTAVSGCYVVQAVISMNKSISLNILRESFEQMARSNSTLRSFFKENTVGNYSYAISESIDLEWKVIDLRPFKEIEKEQKIEIILNEDRTKGFNIHIPPLFRVSIILLDEVKTQLLFSFHHLILDGWSLSLFLNKLNKTYFSILNKETIVLKNDINQHELYINWIKSRDVHLAANYWKNYLKGVYEITAIPFHNSSYRSADVSGKINYNYIIEKNLFISIKNVEKFTKTNKVTLNTMMLASLGLLLQYLTGNNEPLIGIVTAVRPPELAGSMKAMGLYINSLPFKFKISDTMCLSNLFQDIQHMLNSHLEYAHYPLHQIKNESNLANKERLFDILFVFENYPVARIESDKNIVSNIRIIEELDLPLTICFRKVANEEYKISALSHQHIYPQDFIQKIIDYYTFYIDNLISGKSSYVNEVNKLSDEEKYRLLNLSSQVASVYPSLLRLEELIFAQAKRTPNAISVQDNTVQWTYSELQEKIKLYTRHLCSIKHTGIIAIALDRRVELVATILSILESGAAFLPLDVKLPPKRLEQILKLSKTTILITDQEHKNIFNDFNVTILTIQQLEEKIMPNPRVLNQSKKLSAEDTAYIIYTSGSTGEPKGVMGSHHSLINRLWWMIKYLTITSQDRFLQKTTISFDVSLWEMFEPLLIGGALILAEPDKQNDPLYLVDIIKEQKISIIHFVPSMLKIFLQTIDSQLIHKNCTTLRAVVCSGEALTPDIANKFNQIFDSAILYNFYGPTEAAIEVSYWQCPKNQIINNVPIGKAIFNTKLYIVNNKREILPEGIIGELVISGDNVAKGYLFNEGLSKERFDMNPYELARVYYTGDLACMDIHGQLYYLGRKDEQIKIRGFRVELGEIEQAILQHSNISLAAVLYDASDNDERLVAFVVEKSPVSEETKKIKMYNKFLSDILPHYMLPSYYVTLSHLPFTQSGKINKKELVPLLPPKEKINLSLDMSISTIEKIKKLCELALGLESIELDDNFFDLGGHSLTALKLMALIKSELHIQMKVIDIFSHPIIRDLAYRVAQEKIQDASTKPDVKKATNYITPIRRMKNAPNLFLIHPIGGTIYRFQVLNEYLLGNWNIYGIEDPGLHSNQYFFNTLESMAEFYIQQIRKIQPTGTYYLGGLSLGGTIAVEMAIQLKSQGETVSPIILFDAWAKYPPEVSTIEYVDRYINAQYEKLKQTLEPIAFKEIPAPHLIVHRQRAKLLEAYKIPNKNFPELVLFKAIDLLSVLKDVDDPRNYWQEFTTKEIPTYLIPGDHDSIFSPENIKKLSSKLSEYLRSVECKNQQYIEI